MLINLYRMNSKILNKTRLTTMTMMPDIDKEDYKIEKEVWDKIRSLTRVKVDEHTFNSIILVDPVFQTQLNIWTELIPGSELM